MTDLEPTDEYVPPGPPVEEQIVHEDATVRVTELLDADGNVVAELHTDLSEGPA